MAWIETRVWAVLSRTSAVATHTGGVDRNRMRMFWAKYGKVATHTGGVDRNEEYWEKAAEWEVATHTGGVDRNKQEFGERCMIPVVATHTGGVDRNQCQIVAEYSDDGSPPTRVAWIETLLILSVMLPHVGRHPHGWRG